MHTGESAPHVWNQAFLNSHFAPAFFVLSAERRRALKILYGFFRLLDDAVDKPGKNPSGLLDAWLAFFQSRDSQVLRAFGQDGFSADLDSVIKTFDIPLFSLLEFIEIGLKQDLAARRFETPMDTERYCYGVAGTVGLACLPIFGVPWQEAKDFAVRLGITVQWINIIRDVGVDADLGRLYLPSDHLEKFGCKEQDILEKRWTPAFQELIRYEAEVARAHFRRAEELFPEKWRKELLPARIMGEIYRKILAKAEKHNYPVLTKKMSLNILEKGIVTWKTIWS